MWSAIGLFPVAGQDLFLIGSPLFDTASLAGHEFVIETKNNSTSNIYVQRALLNNKELDRAYLHFHELEAGGRLVLEMGSTPTAWGQQHHPPSVKV